MPSPQPAEIAIMTKLTPIDVYEQLLSWHCDQRIMRQVNGTISRSWLGGFPAGWNAVNVTITIELNVNPYLSHLN